MTRAAFLPDPRLALPGVFAVVLGILAAVTAAWVWSPTPAAAQQTQRIAAVVNDEVISLHDVMARMDLVIATSGMPDTNETRQRLMPQVLRKLTEETLQMQEARRLGINVSEQAIERAIAQIERQFGLPPGGFEGFLRQEDLNRETAIAQIRAEVAWVEVIRRSLMRDITIGEDEIDAVLERIQARRGQPEHLLAEIFITVENPAQENEARAMIERLIDAMREGASFSSLARQFSQSPTAAVGGDLGWVPQGQLEPELDEVVRRMQPGELSHPVRTIGGYHLLLLRDRRAAGGASDEDATVELAQIFLPRDGNRAFTPEQRERTLARIREEADSCQAMSRIAGELGTPMSGNMGTLRVGDLAPALQGPAMNAPIGQPSEPIESDAGTAVLMVCAREASGTLPDREEIAAMLEAERAEMLARRHLRDLRRAALIEVRL